MGVVMRRQVTVMAVTAVVLLVVGLLAGAALGPVSRSFDSVDVECPTAQDVQYDLTSSLTVSQTAVTSTARLTVRATGLVPPVPAGGTAVGYDTGERVETRRDALDVSVRQALVGCLVGTSATLSEYTWSQGRGTFVLDLRSAEVFGGTGSGLRPPLVVDLSGDDSAVLLDLCPAVRAADDVPLVCRAAASSTSLTVRDDSRQIFELVRSVAPQPQTVSAPGEDGAVTYTWRSAGAGPAVAVAVRTSWPARAGAWLSSSAGRVVTPPVTVGTSEVRWSVTVASLLYLAGALLLAAVLAAVVRTGAAAALAVSFACLPVAVGVVRLDTRTAQAWSEVAGYLLQVLAWTVVAVATVRTGSGRRTALVLGVPALLAVGLGSASLLVATGRWDGPDPVGTCAAALLVATAAGVVGLVGRAWALRQLLPPGFRFGRRSFDLALTVAVTATVAFALGLAAGSVVGSWNDPDPFSSRARLLLRSADYMSSSLGFSAASLAPLLVAATAAAAVTRAAARPQGLAPPPRVLAAASLVLVTANSVGGLSRVVLGVLVPLWLVAWWAVRLAALRLARRGAGAQRPPAGRQALLNDALADETARAGLVELDKAVDGRRTTVGSLLAARAGALRDTRWGSGRRLMEWGDSGWWLRNAQRAALIGLGVAAVPVGYFLVTALDVRSVTDSGAPLVLFVALTTEVVRWLVPSFVFGMLYGVLPGRTGPVKALALTALWFAGVAASTLAGSLLGLGVPGDLAYRSLQLLVFLQVVAVLYDLATVRRAGGGWRQLRALYSLRNYTDLGTSLVPALLAVVALAQQLASGSGLDVAETALNGVSAVLGAGSR